MKKLLVILITVLLFVPKVNAAEDLAPNSKSAIMLEASTGKVLFEKNSTERLAPASMTKIMSMLLIMEAIDSGKLSLEDDIIISKTAADMGGSQIFLQEGETYKLKDLLKGVAVASGNDAVVALAEKLSGSVEAFVIAMNQRADELGCNDSNFINPHGLDAENHYSSAKDMLLMAKELIKHEKILEFTSIYEDYLKKPDGSSIWLVNTNRLVRFYDGVDGLKTGFTSTAGYCLTSTAKKNNIRFITVVMGVETSDKRSEDTVNLLNYGFNTFKLNTILTTNESLGKARVENADKEFVDIVLKENITELLKNTDDVKNYTYNLKLEKLEGNINQGDKVGIVEVIDNEGNIIMEKEVTVKESCKKASLWQLINRNLKELTSGKVLMKN